MLAECRRDAVVPPEPEDQASGRFRFTVRDGGGVKDANCKPFSPYQSLSNLQGILLDQQRHFTLSTT